MRPDPRASEPPDWSQILTEIEAMCGRYTLSTPAEVISASFDVDEVPDLAARFNIAPSQETIIIVETRAGDRRCGKGIWGLEPPWQAKAGDSRRFINARIETVGQKPAFRASFARRRCLVPADGFYEWKKEPGGKVPVFFSLRDGAPFAFAGIWSPPSRDDERPGFAILTTWPNATVEPVHQRMPVILEPPLYAEWLTDVAPSENTLSAVAKPFPAERMQSWPVSRLVNSPANDSSACVARIDG